MSFFDSGIGVGRLTLLVVALAVVFGFEFVNGFHDTANAVATVIYTRSLKPWFAVIWSGFCNFLGVYLGGIAVAMSIIKLLPVELLASSGTGAGLAMVLALLLAAILWNLGTWYFGLPASSSHTLIGAIVGVGLANSMMPGHVFGTGVNWHKVQEIGLSLVVSPLFGLLLAGLLLVAARKFLASRRLHESADPEKTPPIWIRALLIGTCSGVSFAHGSNDGQKGVGLVMLILIGILPADFALNGAIDRARLTETVAVTHEIEQVARNAYAEAEPQELAANAPIALPESPTSTISADLTAIRRAFEHVGSLRDVPTQERWALRTKIQRVESNLALLEKEHPTALSKDQSEALKKKRQVLKATVEYAPPWVLIGIALALGIGTMIGWKRIVVTVGEKIGKTHMSYAQGASAEFVAASTIGASAYLGLPVSTTHVLSSGIAGTMIAQKSGLQKSTVRNIALAWVLTLPVSMILAAVLFVAFRAMIPDAPDKIRPAVDTTLARHDPEVTPPVQVAAARPLRLHGSNTIGARLAPALAEAFFATKGATGIARRAGTDRASWIVNAQMPGEREARAVEIVAEGSAVAFSDLLERKCDIGIASRRVTPEEAARLAGAGLGDLTSPASEHVLGLDGIAVIANPNNAKRDASIAEIARLFSGESATWPGSTAPVALYARDERSGTFDVFRALVLDGRTLATGAKRFADNAAIADAVAGDAGGLGFVPMGAVRGAKALAIGETPASALFPSEFTVATEDYPLTRRLYLYTTSATHDQPFAQDFVTFALSAEGQRVVADSGFVNLDVRAVDAPACDGRCPPRLASLARQGQRLSVDFRFRTGTSTLDARAQRDLERVVTYLGAHSGAKLALFGFADNQGSSEANAQLSRERADAVAAELRARGVAPSVVDAFGDAMPVAPNTTPAGREHNRRVEVWLLPR